MDLSDRIKFEIFRGSRYGLPEGKRYTAGHALQFDEKNYFVLKFWFQPGVTYFISKNDDESPFHTVFAKKVQGEDGSVRFQNPIGYARGLPDNEHLEIVLPDFSRRYYMSLFPSK